MTDFDYRPKPGFTIDWVLRVSGYDEKISEPIPKNYRYLYLMGIDQRAVDGVAARIGGG
jgi:hypothetical protein